MKKFIYIGSLLLFVSLLAYAATMNVANTGVWTNTATWTGGLIPGTTDDVTMSNSKDVTVENGDNILVTALTAANNNTITIDVGGTLTLDNNPGTAFLTAGNGIVVNVDGTLIINGDVVINNNLIFNVTGTLQINGNVSMNNNATLDVAAGGAVDLNGDFTGGNGTTVNVDGTMDVSGNISVGNGSALTGGGTMTTGGTCSDGEGGSGFCSGQPLPIELLYFEGKTTGNQIKLEWASASEVNFDYYTIEKSVDAVVFDKLIEITGNGASEQSHAYSFVDEVPIMGLNFYRLKATDLDGSYKYHKIIGINYDNEQVNDFKMYPNPTFDGEITVRPTFTVQDGSIEVYDSFGILVLRTNINSLAHTIQLPDQLKPGIYFVKLRNGGSISSRRLILHK